MLSQGNCTGCPSGLYYDLETSSCYRPKLASNTTELFLSGRAVSVGNHTLKNLNVSIVNDPYPVVICPRSAPIFNGTGCVYCPKGTYYLMNNYTCYTPHPITNITALKASKFVLPYKGVTLTTLEAALVKIPVPVYNCPGSFPLYNGTNCVVCPLGTYYLLNNNTCYVPQVVTNVTELKTTGRYVNVGNHTLFNIAAKIAASKFPVIHCPSSDPVYNGSGCVRCLPSQFYNLGNLSCQNPTIITNTVALKLLNKYLVSPNYNMTTIEVANSKVPFPFKECPSTAPLFNGTSCIVCKNKLYDLVNKVCASCASGYYYLDKINICVPVPKYYPNLNNTNWIVDNSSGLSQLIAMRNQRKLLNGSIMCPNSAPDFNIKINSCGKCPTGQFWNYQSLTCVSCTNGSSFNAVNRTCSKPLVGRYQTDLAAPNLLFNGYPKAQYQYIQTQNALNYPVITNCPAATPYFDGFNCIGCSAPFPLFSMKHKACASCPVGSTYHPTIYTCVYPTGQLPTSAPNIGKMYSSIF